MKAAGLLLATAVATTGGVPQQVEHIDPLGAYTQVVTSADRGIKTVFASGQVGAGDDFAAHVESAFERIVERIEEGGASIEDVVKIRVFVKDLTPERYRTVAEARRQTFREGSWPASTVAGVQALAREPFLVEVEAIAVVAEPGAELEIERMAPSNGLSGAVAVTAHGIKTIYVSGQVGGGDDLAGQGVAVWERIAQRLEEADATLADLVKTTTYIVDFDPETDMGAYRSIYPEPLGRSENKPASTLLGVPALAAERFLIEIDAIAVVEDGAAIEREFIDRERTYTQAVTVRGSGPETVYLSGQIGTRGDPLANQADQVYANIVRRLEAAGASPAELLKITVYIPGYSETDLQALAAARQEHGFFGDTAPASTLLGIQSLYSREAAVEIEGIAVVGR